MKSYYSFLIVAVVLTAFSCSSVRYNKVYQIDDEFRNNTKKYTRIHLRPEDRRTEIGSATMIFEKQIDSEGQDVSGYFVVSRSSSSFKVAEDGFMKAGNNKIELKLKDPVSEFKSRSEATISGLASVDSSGTVTGQSADIDTRTWIEDKFIVNLSQEAVKGISEAKNVMFRFYFGPIPATYELEGKKLYSVQRVLKQD